MAFSRDTIDHIRHSADIVELIGRFVNLRRAGQSYVGLSPFNKEKTPSFNVNPHLRIFKCFSSGNGGDVFRFFQLYENLDFPASVRRVAELSGIPLPEDDFHDNPDARRSRDLKEILLRLHSQVVSLWRDNLLRSPSAQIARDYMKERQIPLDWAEKFGLGYASDSWDEILRWATKSRFSEEHLVQAGLAIRNDQGRVYDRFRGRLMFPICDSQGRPVAFSGRVLLPDEKSAKYINSPETPIFKKSQILFGFDRARRAILDAEKAIVCEGQIDVLRCHSEGILNVVAPLGTAFGEAHARILKRDAKRILICLDADRAGQAAARRVGEQFLESEESLSAIVQADLGIQVVRLPEGQDPDSLITGQGPDAFRKLLEAPVDFLDFMVDHLRAQHPEGTASDMRLIVESIADLLSRVESLAVRDRLVLQAATRLNISAAAIEQALKAASSRKRQQQRYADLRSEETAPPSDAAPPRPQERPLKPHPVIEELILLILSSPELATEVRRRLSPSWVVEYPGSDFLFDRLIQSYEDGEWTELSNLISTLTGAEQDYMASLGEKVSHLAETSLEGREKAVVTISQKLEMEDLSRKILSISQKLRETSLPPDEKEAFTQEIFQLQKRKSGLTKT